MMDFRCGTVYTGNAVLFAEYLFIYLREFVQRVIGTPTGNFIAALDT
jgi:hypothetical protein